MSDIATIGVRFDTSGLRDGQRALKQTELAGNATATSLNNAALSAKQLSAAMRGVPAQATDIFVSLASGQNPMTVLLQQGGQLKDMFGGIGNAARAMGSYIASIATPLNVSIAAAAGIAYGIYSGAEGARDLERGLILAGNAANTTNEALQSMADSLVAANKSIGYGGATEALSRIASSGLIAADQMQSVAQASIAMSKTSGQSIDDIVSQFETIGKEPVKAAIKLNEQYHFLTATIFEQARAAQESGNKSESARIIIDALGKSGIDAAEKIKASAGLMSRGFDSVKESAIGLWNYIQAIGRPETLQSVESRIKSIQQQLSGGIKFQLGFVGADNLTGSLEKELDVLNKRKGALIAANDADKASLDAKQKSNAQTDAAIKFHGLYEVNLSKTQKRTRELAEAERLYRAAGDDSADALKRYQSVIDGINDKYKESASHKSAQINQYENISSRVKELISRLEEEKNTNGKLNETQRLRISIESDIEKSGAKLTASNKSQIKSLLEKSSALELELEQIRVSNKAYEETVKQQDQRDNDLQRQIKSIIEETAKIGLSKEQIELHELALLNDSIAQKENAIIKAESTSASAATIEWMHEEVRLLKELANARQNKANAEAKQDWFKEQSESAKKFQSEIERVNNQIEQSLTDALMRSFENGGDFGRNFANTLKSLFATLVLRPQIQALVSGTVGGLNSGSGQGSGGIGSGMLSSSSNFATSWIGEKVGLSSAGNLTELGTQFKSLSDSIGGLSGAVSYASSVKDIFGGDAIGRGIGTAVGQYFGGPLGSFIGSQIGAAVDKAFSGETRAGGQYSYNQSAGTTFMQGPSGGQIAGDQVTSAIASTVNGINDLLKKAGATAAISAFQAGLESSVNGRGGVYAGGTLSTGQTFGESGQGSNYNGTLYEKTSSQSVSASEALANFNEDLAQVTIQALQAANVGGMLGQKLTELGDAEKLTAAQATSVVSQLQQLAGFTEALKSLPFKNLAEASLDAAYGLSAASGGFESLINNLNAYYGVAYTSDEKRLQLANEISKTLQGVGLTVTASDVLSASREQYRNLTESIDVSTEAGQKQAAALYSVANAFDTVVTKTEELNANFGATAEYVSTLKNSISEFTAAKSAYSSALEAQSAAANSIATAYKSAKDALADANTAYADAVNSSLQKFVDVAKTLDDFLHPADAENYAKILKSALAGDADAMSKLASAAQGAIDKAKDSSATAADYLISKAKITAEVSAVKAVAEAKSAGYKAPDPIADALQNQVDATKKVMEMAAMMRETASITGVSLSTLSTVQDQTKLLFFDFISAVADTKTAKDTLAESAASLLAKISENTGAAARVLDDEGLRISDTESVDLIVSAASADATNSNLWKFLSSDKKGGDYLATIYNTVISPKSTLGKLLSGGTNFTANLSGLTFADVMQTSGNLMDVVWGSSVDFSATAKKLDVDSFLASTSQGLYDAVVNGKTSFDTELGSVDISALTEQEKALIIDGKGDYTATVSAFFTDADLTAKQTKTLFSSVSFTKSLNLIKGKTWTDSIENVLSNASATNGYSYSVDLVLRDLAGDSILSFSKQGMATAFERLIINTASAASALNKIASTAFPALDTTNFGSIYNSYEVPAFASGGNYAGGLALVGEQGPELINFDSPGRVYTAQETSGMLSGVNSPEVVGLLKQVISDGRVNAQALANVMLRVARLLEKWEGFGIPETRTI